MISSTRSTDRWVFRASHIHCPQLPAGFPDRCPPGSNVLQKLRFKPLYLCHMKRKKVANNLFYLLCPVCLTILLLYLLGYVHSFCSLDQVKAVEQWSAKCLIVSSCSCIVADAFAENVKLDFQEHYAYAFKIHFPWTFLLSVHGKWAQQEEGHRATKLAAKLDRWGSYLYDPCCFPLYWYFWEKQGGWS